MNKFSRGQVWWCNAPITKKDSCVIMKKRPVVIVSNDRQNERGMVVQVIPFSRSNSMPSIHPAFDFRPVGNCITHLVRDQIRTVDKFDLTDFIGTLSTDEMTIVDQHILEQLGLVVDTPYETYIPELPVFEEEVHEDTAILDVEVPALDTSKPVLSQIDKFNKKYGLGEYAPKKEEPVAPAPVKERRKHWSDEKRKEYLVDYNAHTMTKVELAEKYGIKASDVCNRASKIRKLLTKKGMI